MTFHGLGATSISMATIAREPELRRYSQSHVDRPGTGATHYPQIDDPDYQTPEVWAGERQAVGAALDRYPEDENVVLAHSMGGAAAQVSDLDRENVAAIILVETSAGENMLPIPAKLFDRLTDRMVRPSNKTGSSENPERQQRSHRLSKTRVALARGITRISLGKIAAGNEVFLASQLGSSWERAVIKHTRAIGHVPKSKSMKSLGKPVFVVRGYRDRLCPDYDSELARKHGAVEINFDAGHWIACEEEAAFNALLAAIMEDPRGFYERCGKLGGKLAFKPKK